MNLVPLPPITFSQDSFAFYSATCSPIFASSAIWSSFASFLSWPCVFAVLVSMESSARPRSSTLCPRLDAQPISGSGFPTFFFRLAGLGDVFLTGSAISNSCGVYCLLAGVSYGLFLLRLELRLSYGSLIDNGERGGSASHLEKMDRV